MDEYLSAILEETEVHLRLSPSVSVLLRPSRHSHFSCLPPESTPSSSLLPVTMFVAIPSLTHKIPQCRPAIATAPEEPQALNSAPKSPALRPNPDSNSRFGPVRLPLRRPDSRSWLGAMMQCLSGYRLLSPAHTHVAHPRLAPTRRGASSLVVVRASDSTSASTSTAEPPLVPSTPDEDVALSPSAPALKSLINEENIMSVISGENILVEDHYERLRVNPEASTSEILKAYQERCAEVNQRSLAESDSQEILNKLKDSVDLLMSEEERRMYDWCLLRKATHTVDYAWPYEADLTQRLDDPTSLVVVPEDDGGNRKVGLFFAGWFVLSCILSIVVGMK